MNLVLYGGGHEWENDHLDLEAISLTGKKSPSFTFIPAGSYESEIEFRALIKQYQQFGVKRFLQFSIDVDFDQTLKDEAFNSDIIHLGGGNTYYFLKYLRSKGMLAELKRFVKNGGVLTGLSAGGILMTPTIDTAGFPEFDCDDNEENLKNLKALGLVNFEFFPHYRNSKRYDKELLAHSTKIKRPLYACPDGSGISVNGKSLKFHGKVYCFFEGKKITVSR
ncbi:Type 1 glutamine amidotransferase-like domain-containing protein [Bacteriovorax sp. Seq25_V]|uniref:Type 1 glutamine amidotransferase-like domain-containing protein n=1 Tax=Bacteriovorax sp. Seq25_V TaxID=1201288 RepID=UPI000389F090|nr:Type 1 glutamine amidotransferase-like domain-containing protein [Bacteriovorax sp. Seq25_V]EQC45427.1 peptidase family S51 [Bacteriovorax sp. Seq25_V]